MRAAPPITIRSAPRRTGGRHQDGPDPDDERWPQEAPAVRPGRQERVDEGQCAEQDQDDPHEGRQPGHCHRGWRGGAARAGDCQPVGEATPERRRWPRRSRRAARRWRADQARLSSGSIGTMIAMAMYSSRPDATEEDRDDPQEPDDGRVDVEVLGETRGHTGDLAVVVAAIETAVHLHPPIGLISTLPRFTSMVRSAWWVADA